MLLGFNPSSRIKFLIYCKVFQALNSLIPFSLTSVHRLVGKNIPCLEFSMQESVLKVEREDCHLHSPSLNDQLQQHLSFANNIARCSISYTYAWHFIHSYHQPISHRPVCLPGTTESKISHLATYHLPGIGDIMHAYVHCCIARRCTVYFAVRIMYAEA